MNNESNVAMADGLTPPAGKRKSIASFARKGKRFFGSSGKMLMIGVLLIVYVGFGLAYNQKHSAQANLKSDIAAREATLSKQVPISNLQDLTRQLDEARAKLSSIQTSDAVRSLPNYQQGLDIQNEMVALGEASGPGNQVQLDSVRASAPVTSKDGTVVLPYTLTLSGSRAALMNFLARLIDGKQLLYGVGINRVALTAGKSAEDDCSLMLDLSVLAQPNPTIEGAAAAYGGTK